MIEAATLFRLVIALAARSRVILLCERMMRQLHDIGEIMVTCGRGASSVCEYELRELGFAPHPVEDTAWSVRGSIEDAMWLNLWLRSAQRVLLPMVSLTARSADELYRGLINEPWECVLFPDGYFSITTSVDMPGIRDPRFAALKAKDAIADRMVKACGRRPDSGGDRHRAVFHLHWRRGQAVVLLDTSGEPLSRRGYRLQSGPAPMQEALAATCVLCTPWRGNSAFINPMCGSGTIAIEAALIAMNRAPGMLRKNFGFMHVKGWHEETWKRFQSEARRAARPLPAGCKIIATDISQRAIDAAFANAKRAGVEEAIAFDVCDFAATRLPPPPGVVMLNPEYGERLGDALRLDSTYRRIGDFFKQKCVGYTGYVFTANLRLAKRIGLRSRRRLILYNANLEGRLIEFELYAGTRDLGKGARR
jgi:putative N6-adenine-specific DNA methylase